MLKPAKHAIPDHVWDYYADLYELGLKHACEIARELGVSPQVVSRVFRRMGAKKGSRARQTVAGLEAFLSRREQRERMKHLSDCERRREQRQRIDAMIDRMMSEIIAAERMGDLSLADERIAETAAVLGVKIARKRKSPAKG